MKATLSFRMGWSLDNSTYLNISTRFPTFCEVKCDMFVKKSINNGFKQLCECNRGEQPMAADHARKQFLCRRPDLQRKKLNMDEYHVYLLLKLWVRSLRSTTKITIPFLPVVLKGCPPLFNQSNDFSDPTSDDRFLLQSGHGNNFRIPYALP